jgi:hypothetical protein
VVVDLGETQILEREEVELSERLLDADLFPLQRLENAPSLLFFHDFPECANYTMQLGRSFSAFLDNAAGLLLNFGPASRSIFPRFSGPFGAVLPISSEFPAWSIPRKSGVTHG